MKEPYKLFKNIKKARTSSGLSQKELAKRLGVSDKTVSAYETGRAIPPTPTLTKIAELTNTSVQELLNTEKSTNENIESKLESIDERLSNLERTVIKLINNEK